MTKTTNMTAFTARHASGPPPRPQAGPGSAAKSPHAKIGRKFPVTPPGLPRHNAREVSAFRPMDDRKKKITPEILDAVRTGDDAASREFVEMLFPLVISIVRNHLPRSEAEEDLCQDVFLKVFARFKQYSGRQPIEHWVSRIALNTCYDRLRRQKTRRVSSFAELGADETILIDQTVSIDGTEEVSLRLKQALQDCPFQYLRIRLVRAQN